MKTKYLVTTVLLSIFCLSISIVSCTQSGSSTKEAEAEVIFSVNLGCAGCQKTVETELPLVKGVKEVKVTLETKEVWVLYQANKTNKAKLVKAIKRIGYQATEITA